MKGGYDLRLYEGDEGDASRYVLTMCSLPRSFTEKTGLKTVRIFKNIPGEAAAKALVAPIDGHKPRAVVISEIEAILSKN